ncbi:hypothetical protein JTE90_020883 [Oedothorax gibbosus]|uniref:Uncharacterized protein n=1 Tax=Oedothorax gibbosus TaxID=931172 RepID=A0AAV6TFQ6_9ARAC|nr:hypothetical protein JTE90_020883 [Oedothorax gibbosus]
MRPVSGADGIVTFCPVLLNVKVKKFSQARRPDPLECTDSVGCLAGAVHSVQMVTQMSQGELSEEQKPRVEAKGKAP